jgi:hypothetical protein
MCQHRHPEQKRDEDRAARRGFLFSLAAAPFLAKDAIAMQSASRSGGSRKAGREVTSNSSAAAMRLAAESLLSALTSDQRAKLTFELNDQERQNWFYTPVQRKGITIKDLDPSQRQLANALLGAGLAPEGLRKAATIISLEPILREIEQGRGPVRDPELYYVSIFGKPGESDPWGWRFEGHHISLNYTVIRGARVASTPSFFGSNPAEVQHGPRKGVRPLATEEDKARAFVKSLDDKQRSVAIVSAEAPRDIITTNSRKADPVKPFGLQANRLGQKQADILMDLLMSYASNMPSDIAAARMDRVKSGGFGNISFAWAGGINRGELHYYRIQGPAFLIEYDDTQNNGNHIHTVWRDFNGDFGLDLLGMHYKDGHR